MYDSVYLDQLYVKSLDSPRPWAATPEKLKRRGWSFVLYEDNMGNPDIGLTPTPVEFIKILQSFHVHMYLIKHDKDLDADGVIKKVHWHVLMMWDGPVSARIADQVRFAVGGIGLEPVTSIKQYARYLCHLDEPNKHKYDTSEVIVLGQQDYLETIESAYNRYQCIDQMTRYIDSNNVRSFYSLMKFCRDSNTEWYRCLLDNVSVMKEYIKGRQYEYDLLNREKLKESLDSIGN